MKAIRTGILAIVLAGGFAASSMAADTYVIDAVHSTIGFSVKHLTVSEVQGNFKTFSGSVTLDAKDATATQLEATIETKSINTQNEGRDKHLVSADFFDADNNPAITFKSKSVKASGNTYQVTGDLTIKGTTKEITIPMTIAGPVKNPMGEGQVIGLSGQTTINRQDYGVKWNKQMDQGGLMISDDVAITINLEAHSKTTAAM
jgi:polyisoprenoid-binding protein YceI